MKMKATPSRHQKVAFAASFARDGRAVMDQFAICHNFLSFASWEIIEFDQNCSSSYFCLHSESLSFINELPSISSKEEKSPIL